MTTPQFSQLAPTESRPLTFDFSPDIDIGETLTGVPTVLVTVDNGIDPSPQSIVVQSQIVGLTVIVAVNNLVDNVDYHITVTCSTSNLLKVLTVAGVLPVRNA